VCDGDYDHIRFVNLRWTWIGQPIVSDRFDPKSPQLTGCFGPSCRTANGITSINHADGNFLTDITATNNENVHQVSLAFLDWAEKFGLEIWVSYNLRNLKTRISVPQEVWIRNWRSTIMELEGFHFGVN
jgi:hypothetical protein